MSETAAIIGVIKTALRERKVTYATVASHLAMSEANVKRMFAAENLSLQRVEEICRLLDMTLVDLIQLYDDGLHKLKHLTEEQERQLVADSRVLLVAVSVRNHLSFQDILANHHITETELIRCLAKLDRLKIIDLLPNNKIKLRIDEAFSWIPNGPIEQFYERAIQREFLAGHFDPDARLFSFGLLGESSVAMLQAKLTALSHEFAQLVRHDRQLPWHKKRSVAMLTAMREWQFSVFKPYVKVK